MKVLIIFGLLLICVDSEFTKSKVDYCQLNCAETNKKYKNTACNCKLPGGNREEYKDDVVKFRIKMLSLHNEFRNKVAMGDSGNEFLPSASDMNVLNYDLELEYLAHCYAGVIMYGNDKCRKTSKFDSVGQSIAFRSDHDYDQLINSGPSLWSNQISLVKRDIVDSFKPIPGTGEFSQFIWAKTKYIGCVPIWNPDAPNSGYRNALICNYAPSGNYVGQSLYKKGKPCDSCTDDCNEKYPGLCGKSEPIPIDPRGSATLTPVNRAILAILVLIHFI